MPDFDFRIPPKAATLRHLVEEKLREAIAAGAFKPGQRLVERELCEMIGVGRTSVREALRQLEADGLVTTVPHRGPSVAVVTADEARQLYEIRAVLESFAGQACAERASEAELTRLTRAVEQFAAAAAARDQAALIAAKNAFYDALMAGCGNIYVEKTLRGLHGRITLLRLTSMTQPGRLARSVEEIGEIQRAIAARDAAAAGRACKRHVELAAAAAMAFLQAAASDAADSGPDAPAGVS